jgi:hypothetical protein
MERENLLKETWELVEKLDANSYCALVNVGYTEKLRSNIEIEELKLINTKIRRLLK